MDLKTMVLSRVTEKIEKDPKFASLPPEKKELLRQKIAKAILEDMNILDWLDPTKRDKFKNELKELMESET